MKVELISRNTKEEIEKNLRIVASAGKLSRFEGTVTQVFEKSNNYNSNLSIARNVVGCGHKSISEHDYLVFALENVTPIIEQIIIGYRLTSFTIKSRRNVDFRTAGFYVPSFRDLNNNILENNNELQEKYKKYMESLFNQYAYLVDEGIPIEDCRYILPYSYYSNIVMGCDAHEFLNITSDMLYGKISKIKEVRELGEKFAQIIEEYVPYLSIELEKEKDKKYYDDKLEFVDKLVNNSGLGANLLDKVQMTGFTENADDKVLISALMARYQCSYSKGARVLNELSKSDPQFKRQMMQAIIKSKNQRELEQVIFSYQIPISLAVLTHITRHRMHSLLVPDFTSFNLKNYITPATISENHKEQYDDIFRNNKIMCDYFASNGVNPYDLVYFLLSGNACNITTTMNARTLEWISRMRCCKKAQWEIRDFVNEMVALASSVAPLIGEGLGPSCEILGICPEGKDSCKNRDTAIKKIKR